MLSHFMTFSLNKSEYWMFVYVTNILKWKRCIILICPQALQYMLRLFCQCDWCVVCCVCNVWRCCVCAEPSLTIGRCRTSALMSTDLDYMSLGLLYWFSCSPLHITLPTHTHTRAYSCSTLLPYLHYSHSALSQNWKQQNLILWSELLDIACTANAEHKIMHAVCLLTNISQYRVSFAPDRYSTTTCPWHARSVHQLNCPLPWNTGSWHLFCTQALDFCSTELLLHLHRMSCVYVKMGF